MILWDVKGIKKHRYIIKKGPLIRALLNVNYWNEFFVFPSANISTDKGYLEVVDV